jgi:cytochrome b561
MKSMNAKSASDGYSALQIVLHWVVVALVLFQLVFGEDMADLFDAVRRGETPSPDAAVWGGLHIWIGFAVLAAVLLRLALRVRHIPPLEEGNRTIARLAQITHIAFYVLLIAMPITGGLAYYLELPVMGEIHEIGKPILIALIALHVLAALWHQFVRRDGLIMRILVPR